MELPNVPIELTVRDPLTNGTAAFPGGSYALSAIPRTDGRVDLVRNGALLPLDREEQAALLEYLMGRVPLTDLTGPLTPMPKAVP